MNTSPASSSWRRLVAAARRAADERDTEAPLGFSTRVAALAFAQPERRLITLFEVLAPRALWIAGALVLASVALNYSALSAQPTAADSTVPDVDPVTVLFSTS